MDNPLKALSADDLAIIIKIATYASRRHPPAELGVSLEEIRETNYGANPEDDALDSALSDLSSAAIYELIAVMWFGRGDFKAEPFAEVVAYAEKTIGNGAVNYVTGRRNAAVTYLSNGCKVLGIALAQ